ncbi:MAG: trypsin-like peptidase domain-containing protein, partial [Planctomycetales bacterium]|nr:trypsin-like peptidase domain-containing protein [Planctomycetales bacterium]
MARSALAMPPEAVLEAERERVATIERATAATLAIMAPGGQGGGSGVIISPDGYALSNYHVTSAAGDAMKCGMPDGKLYDAVIVAIDPTGDVALLKVLGRDDFPHAQLGDSNELLVGDWCFVSGNPFLLANDFTPTVSYGIVSGVHRYQYPAGTLLEYADCIQTDAAINPGNSGGPLWNSQGELIGINGRGSFEKRGRVNVGVGYAISINQIKHFLGYLKSGRVVDHATLGATVTTDEDGAVVVDEILETSDAYRRGLRYDDEIVEFGGREIGTVNAFKNVLGIFPRGWRVPLAYRREGTLHRITVRLAALHREGELLELLKQGEHPTPPSEGDEPNPESPEDEPKPEPPHPQAMAKKKPKMPDIVAAQFEKREGYVNYFFNRQNRERIWKAFRETGDFSQAAPQWTFSGDLAAGGEFKL